MFFQLIPCLRFKAHEASCEKPFHCRQCKNTQFSCLNYLNRHLQTVHKVPETPEELQQRLKEMGQKCNKCSRYFSSRRCLMRHNKRLHSDKSEGKKKKVSKRPAAKTISVDDDDFQLYLELLIDEKFIKREVY